MKEFGMRVFVVGATGVLGRAAVPLLLAGGDQVTGMARNADRVAAVAKTGAEPVVVDLFDTEGLARALRGHDAVVNLATRIPSGLSLHAGQQWRETDRIRSQGSRSLVDAALTSGDVRVIVQEGVSFGYADGGDRELDETAPMDVPAMMRSVDEAHTNAARFGDSGSGRAGVGLRIGRLLGDDPLTLLQLRGARYGVPLLLGDRSGWTSVIHPADAAAAAVSTLNAPSGVYNVGAPPVRKDDLGAVLARAAGVRRARAVPRWLASRLGPAAAMARSQRVVCDKLTETTGWRPEHPTPEPSWMRPSG